MLVCISIIYYVYIENMYLYVYIRNKKTTTKLKMHDLA